MDWKPDRTAKKAIYKQLAEFIEDGIADGSFPVDKPLPSERFLAKEMNINRSTVVAAYDELESLGLIKRMRGSGTTINKDIWGMTKNRIPSWNRYVEAGSILPNLPVTQKIRQETVENHLINLASGELSEDLFPIKFLRNFSSSRSFVGSIGYDHPQGNKILRETISNHVYKYRRITCNPASILITSGAQQALHLVVSSLLKPGDAVAIQDPSYHYSLPIFKSAGIRTFNLPVDENGMNPEELVTLHERHRIKMIFLNPIFQNPTGTLLNEERRKRILEISSEYGIPVIEDDPYSLTSFHGDISTLKSLDTNGNVLYISSLSKIVAPGLRIGWIIGPKSVIERLTDVKQQIDFGHGSLTQWFAHDFLESNEFKEHIRNLVMQLKNRRDQIVVSLTNHLEGQVDFYEPQGGIHLWCRIKKDFNEMQLFERSINKGIIYVPGSTLGTDRNCVRFTFARENEENIEEGIKRFASAINEIQ